MLGALYTKLKFFSKLIRTKYWINFSFCKKSFCAPYHLAKGFDKGDPIEYEVLFLVFSCLLFLRQGSQCVIQAGL